ncbi:hypothetical protein [Methylotuvimicrobium buryatense]|uniref:Uncharacterized protein n=1 Tax=Methylotuvimicrobium buryatense TaxID=95641 RepID=A0A4P9UJI2_METBY|nr:hypothetical protein [Methylotuvimicrobium buryatense]QCW81284.1 hypothetical protein EQU24_02695 [Methylotuvimicrobium buryatense]
MLRESTTPVIINRDSKDNASIFLPVDDTLWKLAVTEHFGFMVSKIVALAPFYMPQFCAKYLILITNDHFHISHFGVELIRRDEGLPRTNELKQ